MTKPRKGGGGCDLLGCEIAEVQIRKGAEGGLDFADRASHV